MTATSPEPRETPSLARDSGRTLVGTVISTLANVAVVLILARALGGAAVGEYTLAFAIRAILVLVCALGMRQAMTRFVAMYLTRGDAASLRGVVRQGVGTTFLVGVGVAAVWWMLAPTLAADLFDNPGLETPMRLMAVSLPFAVLMEVALAATRGFSTMRPFSRIGLILEPGLRAVLTGALVLGGGGVVSASAALLAAGVLAGVLALVALARMLGSVDEEPPTFPTRELVEFGLTSWVASMATQGLLWTDVLILGALVEVADVGAYQVAARVVLIAMFVVTPLATAMAPRVAAAWERDDRESLTDRYAGVVRWSARLSWPVLAGVLAAPALVVGIFGAEFTAAVAVVQILAIGAVAEAVGGSGGVLFNQIGRNRVNMWVNAGLLGLNIALNLVLIPIWGIEGSALAWSITMLLGALSRTWFVRRFAATRSPVDQTLLRAGLAAAVAGGAGWLVAEFVPLPTWPLLVLVGLVVVGVYSVVLVLVGLARGERAELTRRLWLKAPALRRWRERLRNRGAVAGTETLSIEELISPFRYDVRLRAELFELADREAELLGTDRPAFLDLAWEGGYGTWFREVLVAKGHVSGSEAERRRTFETIVDSALSLQRRMRADGWSSLGPVTVTRLEAGVEVGGWRVDEARWVLVDGGHRIALALSEGRTALVAGDYLIVDESPPNNTAWLATQGVLTGAQVEEFAGISSRPH